MYIKDQNFIGILKDNCAEKSINEFASYVKIVTLCDPPREKVPLDAKNNF